ncbi:uncharacterized protein LOC122389832 [Amphibalanus amphitrite]|uniref:uncharacterized protein LOC122389832 n=1 Tax=Amphibalanus amphitrite TaxID=1232801 RepID=UPI001C92B515|nr:uncharacterized protein LOC122389832 [Amphibalanus amphitrite]
MHYRPYSLGRSSSRVLEPTSSSQQLVPSSSGGTSREESPDQQPPAPWAAAGSPQAGADGKPPISVAQLIREERLRKALQSRRSFKQRLCTLINLTAAMLIIGGGAALLFLVPIVVDPAVATIQADFPARPTACRTERVRRYRTHSNCSWSSCREGCTSDLYYCVHVYVSHTPTEGAPPAEAILVVNVKTCGYPPRVNCSAFEDEYAKEGAVFQCFVSGANASIAVAEFQPGQAGEEVLHALGIPLGAICLGTVTVCVLQLRPARCRRRPAQQRRPSAELKRSQQVWSTGVSPSRTAPTLSTVIEERGGSAVSSQPAELQLMEMKPLTSSEARLSPPPDP